MRYTDEDIQKLVNDFYKENGHAPTKEDLAGMENAPNYQTVSRRLGMSPKEYCDRKEKERLLVSLKAYLDEYKELPPELADESGEGWANFANKTGITPQQFCEVRRFFRSHTPEQRKVLMLYSLFAAWMKRLPEEKVETS